MQYIHAARIVTGTVWAPGPLPLSVWVLPDAGGAPVVVKVPHGDVNTAHAVDYATPVLVDGSAGLSWHHGDRGSRWAPDAVVPVGRYHHAPKLPARVWREVTA